MTFEIRKVEKKRLKLKIGIQGPSGSGKTYSALKLANGIEKDWENIFFIDTENESASYYESLGPFNHLPFEAPYSPARYIEAIDACLGAGAKVIIIDSLSHEWEGKGGCLEMADEVTKKMRNPNSFTAWRDVTPLHNAFVDHMRTSPCHIICCTRTKQEYAMETNSKGKIQPKKVGLKGVQRDGLDYEFGLVFELDMDHMAFSGKDRTGLFMDKPKHMINEDTGRDLLRWANSGADPIIETYQATDAQKRQFASLAKMHDVTAPETLKELSEMCIGKPITEIGSEIQMYIANK